MRADPEVINLQREIDDYKNAHPGQGKRKSYDRFRKEHPHRPRGSVSLDDFDPAPKLGRKPAK